MITPRRSPRGLEVIEGSDTDMSEWLWLCGHCASPSPSGEIPAPEARVCPTCGMGLLLETRRAVAPNSRDSFLVVDGSLLIQAMSRRAERLLGVPEELAVNRPVTELLVPADAEDRASRGLAAAVVEAVERSDGPMSAYVRAWNTFGVRVRARVAACGPPRAALVVLEGSARRRPGR